MKLSLSTIVLFFSTALGAAAAVTTKLPTPAQRHIITADQAMKAIEATIAYSNKIGVPNNIAIVDPFARLVAFLRMDNAFLGSVDISQKKAEASVFFNGIPNYALYTRAQPGGDLYGIEETNDVIVLFGGGQPIFDNRGYFIGAIGVSGGTVQQDIDSATAGAEAVGFTVSA